MPVLQWTTPASIHIIVKCHQYKHYTKLPLFRPIKFYPSGRHIPYGISTNHNSETTTDFKFQFEWRLQKSKQNDFRYLGKRKK
jgi:hypothetical protein